MAITDWFRGKPKPEKSKPEGALGCLGLMEWWLSTFSPEEREHIEQLYRPMAYDNSSTPLTKGDFIYISVTPTNLLSNLASWFPKREDYHLACKMLDKAETISDARVQDVHYTYQQMIQTHYQMRDVYPTALDAAIGACKKQIAFAPTAAIGFKQQEGNGFLPEHTGYKQLSIILEKQKCYTEAIELCEQAEKQGWHGDWGKRIERCRKKLMKA